MVVTGAGTAFCSGGDLSWIGGRARRHGRRRCASPDAAVLPRPGSRSGTSRCRRSRRSTGPAIGAGLALALACDLRYAADDARLGVPFTSLGMHPGMATTYLLPEVAGLAVAREMLLTGRLPSPAPRRPRLGLVNRAVPARRGARRGAGARPTAAAAAAPVATRLTKRALLGGGHASFDAALEWEALAQPVTLATADLQEGLRAPAGAARRRGSPAADRPPGAAVGGSRDGAGGVCRPRTRPGGPAAEGRPRGLRRRWGVAAPGGSSRSPRAAVRTVRLPLANVPAGRPGGFVGRTRRSPARAASTAAPPRLWTSCGRTGRGDRPACRCGAGGSHPVDNPGDDHAQRRLTCDDVVHRLWTRRIVASVVSMAARSLGDRDEAAGRAGRAVVRARPDPRSPPWSRSAARRAAGGPCRPTATATARWC